MRKKIILMLLAVCAISARASVQTASVDTIHYNRQSMPSDLYTAMEPTYLNEVLVPSTWSGNWFVGVSGGANAFIGKPLGCDDLFGRIKPTFQVSLGKWFTPSVGGRMTYSGCRFKDSEKQVQKYQCLHADFLWNVLGSRYGKQETERWGIIPYAGVGLLHNRSNGQKPFTLAYGIIGQYHINKRISATAEIGNLTTFQSFDGRGENGKLGDHLLSASLGLSFNIGKVGWKRAIDATPYMLQNEMLISRTNELLATNHRYASQHDKDARTLAELKKILAIEGLLDKYGSLFDADNTFKKDFPKNDYSGLNSLRARLRNRHWDGKSPFPSKQNNADADDTTNSGANADYLSLMRSGNECIGSPIQFFFEIGTDRLTDDSQLVNLDELARVAKKYDLMVSVAGAADSATGTAAINNHLGTQRADFIVSELVRRGVPPEHINKSNKGGISDYTPDKANRHTKVMLDFR